jgi:hypothetical protein
MMGPRRPGLAPACSASKGKGTWTGVLQLGSPAAQREQTKKSDSASSKQREQLAVVSILCRHELPHFSKPHKQGPTLHTSSSGVILDSHAGLVVTTASAVYYAEAWQGRNACKVSVCIQDSRASGPLPALVLAVSVAADLALLEVQPQSISGLPAMKLSQEAVQIGCPVSVAGTDSHWHACMQP